MCGARATRRQLFARNRRRHETRRTSDGCHTNTLRNQASRRKQYQEMAKNFNASPRRKQHRSSPTALVVGDGGFRRGQTAVQFHDQQAVEKERLMTISVPRASRGQEKNKKSTANDRQEEHGQRQVCRAYPSRDKDCIHP